MIVVVSMGYDGQRWGNRRGRRGEIAGCGCVMVCFVIGGSLTIVGDHGEAEAVRTQGFKRSSFKLQTLLQ